MKIKITDKNLRQLPFSDKQQLYFDEQTPGFGVCVGKTKKSYFVQKTKNYKTSRVTLGTYPDINPTIARERALKISSQIVSNDDFKSERHSKRALNQITLQRLYDQYKPSLKAQGKIASLDEYPKILNRHFYDWLDKPITNITRDAVVKRHQKITENSGPAIANKSFRVLRALFSHAKIDNDQLSNPVQVLKDRKLWNIEKPKKNKLHVNEIELWMKQLIILMTPVMKYYLIFILIHGLRRSEASNLLWDQVDLKNNHFTIKNTKNKQDLILPITSYTKVIFGLLAALRINEFVFPSKSIKSDQIKAPRRALGTLNKLTGTNITAHDLRRTFVSVAHNHVSPYVLKRLVNHSTRNDVTDIYVSHSPEELQVPLESIQTRIFGLSKVTLEDLS